MHLYVFEWTYRLLILSWIAMLYYTADLISVELSVASYVAGTIQERQRETISWMIIRPHKIYSL